MGDDDDGDDNNDDDDDDDGNCKMTEFEEDIEDLQSVDAGSVKLGGR